MLCLTPTVLPCSACNPSYVTSYIGIYYHYYYLASDTLLSISVYPWCIILSPALQQLARAGVYDLHVSNTSIATS